VKLLIFLICPDRSGNKKVSHGLALVWSLAFRTIIQKLRNHFLLSFLCLPGRQLIKIYQAMLISCLNTPPYSHQHCCQPLDESESHGVLVKKCRFLGPAQIIDSVVLGSSLEFTAFLVSCWVMLMLLVQGCHLSLR
jgi:hypothetical protein